MTFWPPSSALLASEDNDFLIRMGVSRKLLTDIMYKQKAVASAYITARMRYLADTMAGTCVPVEGETVELLDPVARGHKFALAPIARGAAVIARAKAFLEEPAVGRANRSAAVGPAGAQHQGNTFLHGPCPTEGRCPQCTY